MADFYSQLREFKQEQRRLKKELSWDVWHKMCNLSCPDGFVMDSDDSPYNLMRKSVASGFGWAWIPCPPDRTKLQWSHECRKFDREKYCKW